MSISKDQAIEVARTLFPREYLPTLSYSQDHWDKFEMVDLDYVLERLGKCTEQGMTVQELLDAVNAPEVETA